MASLHLPASSPGVPAPLSAPLYNERANHAEASSSGDSPARRRFVDLDVGIPISSIATLIAPANLVEEQR